MQVRVRRHDSKSLKLAPECNNEISLSTPNFTSCDERDTLYWIFLNSGTQPIDMISTQEGISLQKDKNSSTI